MLSLHELWIDEWVFVMHFVSDNLLSGLLGAIIGSVIAGVFTYVAAVRAARLSARQALGLFGKERDLRERGEQGSIREWLLQELKFDRGIIGTGLAGTRASMAIDAWLAARGRTGFLGCECEGRLLKAYSELHRYNDAVQFDLLRGSGVGSGLETPLKQFEKRMPALLDEAIELVGAAPQA